MPSRSLRHRRGDVLGERGRRELAPPEDKPTRVLWLIKGLGPGGAERLLLSVAQAHDPLRVRYAVAYLLPWKNHLVAEIEAAGVSTHLLSSVRGLVDPVWPLRLRKLIVRGNYDVVHVHSPAVGAMARPIVRMRRRRPRLASTEHNLWSSFGRPTRWLNAATLPLDDLRLAVSEEVRASLWPGWRRRTSVLVHGVPVVTLAARRPERGAARAELGIGERELAIGIVANLRASKDYPTLLAAAAEAIKANEQLLFVAVGQGPLDTTLRAEAERKGLGSRFRFLGYHADPPRVLAACDLFTLSSRHEGLPIALLEALALGLPVVATTVGGIPTVIRHGEEGVLVPPGRPDLLSSAYLELARDEPKRRQMGLAAADRAMAFDITVAARRLEELYQDLRAGR